MSVRVLSYHLARTDVVLGKVDLIVDSLGDPFRPPDVGAAWVRPSSGTGNANVAPFSSVSSSPPPPSATTTARSRRARDGLSHRCAQDFWLPLHTTTAQVTHLHNGLTCQPIEVGTYLLPIPNCFM
jgi:hypothetical protein